MPRMPARAAQPPRRPGDVSDPSDEKREDAGREAGDRRAPEPREKPKPHQPVA